MLNSWCNQMSFFKKSFFYLSGWVNHHCISENFNDSNYWYCSCWMSFDWWFYYISDCYATAFPPNVSKLCLQASQFLVGLENHTNALVFLVWIEWVLAVAVHEGGETAILSSKTDSLFSLYKLWDRRIYMFVSLSMCMLESSIL